MHTETHPQSGNYVQLPAELHHNLMGNLPAGTDFQIEDWWDHLTGGSWMYAVGNAAALAYAFRAGLKDLPVDDDVVYGKIKGLGVLVHISELPHQAEVVPQGAD